MEAETEMVAAAPTPVQAPAETAEAVARARVAAQAEALAAGVDAVKAAEPLQRATRKKADDLVLRPSLRAVARVRVETVVARAAEVEAEARPHPRLRPYGALSALSALSA